MSKPTTKILVPKLRFPEFRDAGDWENEPLEKLYSFKVTNSLSRDNLNYENGSVKNIHYGDIHTKFSTLFKIDNEIVPFINPSVSFQKIKPESYCIEGDIIIADASEDLDDVGKSIEIVNLNSQKLLSGLHTILSRQIDNKLIIGFGGHLFKSELIRVQIKKEAQGAKVLGISKGRLSKVKVSFPSNKSEQQKIADCLSSIDDLITAHTQKHDALKAHKKGLMQQLFPSEGETVPNLRFPEFRDAGAWDLDVLDKLVDVVDGDRGTNYPKSYEFSEAGFCLFLNAKNVTKNGFKFEELQFITKEKDEALRKGKLQHEDVVLTTRGSIGQFAYFTKDVPYENMGLTLAWLY